MLFLLFTLGKARYGLEARQVVEIVPAVPLRELPHAPDVIAGVFNYRETIVPVVDLQQLTTQQPCAHHLSTRIIVVNFKTAAGVERSLGLMAEKVTEAVHIAPEEFKSTGITLTQAPYLGSIAVQRKEIIQCLQVNRILPPAVQETIFRG